MLANTANFLFQVIGSDEAFSVLDFQVQEAVSELYAINVVAVTTNAAIDLSSLIGKPAVLTLLVANQPSRLFHGELIQISQQESGRRFTSYRFLLVPKFWFLQQRSGCRIFQDKSIPEIIEQVFSEANFSQGDFRLTLDKNYDKRTYCVQYHESEYHFLSRLMEEEGLFYFFEHHLDRHVMVITDHINHFDSILNGLTLPYHPKTGNRSDSDCIYQLNQSQQRVPGSVLLHDYNFEKPNLSLFANSDTGSSELNLYEQPGDFLEPARGRQLADIRRLAYQAKASYIEGKTDNRHLRAGGKFLVRDHNSNAFNREYNCLATSIYGKQPQALEEGASSGGSEFHIAFNAIPDDVDFKAPMYHAKPRIDGVQTAFVTGPQGEEIYTDQHGRIKVQFHWDREGTYNEQSSCWIRANQGLAGNEWGALLLPRVGQEVVITFIEGNPDRPVVSSTLYHGVNLQADTLPANKTRSGIKTQSYPGGGGYNEIRIDDSKGSEQIYLHAQKDFDTHIKNDQKEATDNNKHTTYEGSAFVAIDGDDHQSIGKNQTIKTGKSYSLAVGKNATLKTGSNVFKQAGKNIHQKAGANFILNGGAGIALKGGSGFITIDPSGVSIAGPQVRINSGGSASSAISASPSSPTAPTSVEPGNPGKPSAIKRPSSRENQGIAFQTGAAAHYSLPTPSGSAPEATPEANLVSNHQPVAPLQKAAELTWLKVRARYDDLWQTPIIAAKVSVDIDGGQVINAQPLQQGTGTNSRSTSQAGAERTANEPGTLVVTGVPKGNATLEFEREPGLEGEINSLKNAINARLNGAYLKLLSNMSEFQAQWDQMGPAAIPLSGAEGLMSGAGNWLSDQGDLLEARTWKELGNTISGTANDVWDYTATYSRERFEEIKQSVANASEFVEEASDNFFNWNWWSQHADEIGEDIEESAVRFVTDVKSDLEQAAETLQSSADKAEKIYQHRHAILELPELLAEGNVSRIEQFIDNVLADIEPELAKEIKNNPEWSAVIELIAEHDAILTYVAYLSLFLEAIPPNFYAYLSGKGGAYVILELLLLLVCSLLSAGIATAGRIAMLSARLSALAAKANKVNQTLRKGPAAIQALARCLEEFLAASKEMVTLGKKLRLARNQDLKIKGRSGTTLEAKKKQEKRNKQCRLCGKANQKTPLHQRGTVEYV